MTVRKPVELNIPGLLVQLIVKFFQIRRQDDFRSAIASTTVSCFI